VRPHTVVTSDLGELRAALEAGRPGNGAHVSTGAEVLAAVRKLSRPGITQTQIAMKAGCSQSQVSLAVRLLAHAPDLADAVSAGTIGLARASAITLARRNPPPPPRPPGGGEAWPPVYLTGSEAAGELSLNRAAVLRLIHAGKLRSVRLGRSYRIPGTEVSRRLAGDRATAARSTSPNARASCAAQREPSTACCIMVT
jgi:excisionase family DNA binding protein